MSIRRTVFGASSKQLADMTRAQLDADFHTYRRQAPARALMFGGAFITLAAVATRLGWGGF